MPTIDGALTELGRPARENHVAHALIWRAAATLARRARHNRERMAELERALERAPQAGRRALTLPIAAAASLAADVGDEEAAKAVAAYAFAVSASRRPSRKQRARAVARLARSLSTKERRRSVRAALAELAELSADEFPRASLALRGLLAEPVPADPAKDELWVSRGRHGAGTTRRRARRRDRALSGTSELSAVVGPAIAIREHGDAASAD